MSEEKESKIQSMRFLEQSIQNLILQKQAFEIELTETESALKEIEKSGEDVFKIIGQLMIKTEKSKIKEELLSKEKILKLRINALEKQEESFVKQLEKIREEVIASKNKNSRE